MGGKKLQKALLVARQALFMVPEECNCTERREESLIVSSLPELVNTSTACHETPPVSHLLVDHKKET
jgi:hypothetical protein